MTSRVSDPQVLMAIFIYSCSDIGFGILVAIDIIYSLCRFFHMLADFKFKFFSCILYHIIDPSIGILRSDLMHVFID